MKGTHSSSISSCDLDKRTQIMLEIRSSERSYVQHLNLIVEVSKHVVVSMV